MHLHNKGNVNRYLSFFHIWIIYTSINVELFYYFCPHPVSSRAPHALTKLCVDSQHSKFKPRGTNLHSLPKEVVWKLVRLLWNDSELVCCTLDLTEPWLSAAYKCVDTSIAVKRNPNINTPLHDPECSHFGFWQLWADMHFTQHSVVGEEGWHSSL